MTRQNQLLQTALLRFHTRAQIEAHYHAALQASLDTTLEGRAFQLTLEGQSMSTQYTGHPAELIEICENCLQILDGRAPAVSTSHIISFANRRLET